MCNVFGCNGRPKSKLASILVAGLVLTFLVTDVSAQDQEFNQIGSNTSYTIKVSRNNAKMCVYEIVGYSDHDLFLIKPEGSIEFQADGTDVLIEIERHQRPGKHYGKPGLKRGQAASFRIGKGEKETVNARKKIARPGNNHTRHKVWIFCLTEAGGEELPVDFLSAAGTSSLHKYDPDQNEFDSVDLRGPMMPAVRLLDMKNIPTDALRRAAGGPTMEVDDP